MSPYRTSASRDADAPCQRARSLPIVELTLLLLSAFRLVVAGVTGEQCGVEVGLATLVGLLSGHAMIRASARTPRG